MSDQHDKPILFLLRHEFEDAGYPGERFFCRHCLLLEGVLAKFPAVRKRLSVRRVAFARPRREVIRWAGEGDQSLPKLVLPPDRRTSHASGEHAGRQYVSGSEAILAVLSELYAIPHPHP